MGIYIRVVAGMVPTKYTQWKALIVEITNDMIEEEWLRSAMERVRKLIKEMMFFGEHSQI